LWFSFEEGEESVGHLKRDAQSRGPERDGVQAMSAVQAMGTTCRQRGR